MSACGMRPAIGISLYNVYVRAWRAERNAPERNSRDGASGGAPALRLPLLSALSAGADEGFAAASPPASPGGGGSPKGSGPASPLPAPQAPRVELQGAELWKRFHEIGTEMIITKAGR